jgi:hypothetical protein
VETFQRSFPQDPGKFCTPFSTYGMQNKIPGIFAITGHEAESVDGFGKISSVAKGYWTQEITDNILEKQATIEKFNFEIGFYKPSLCNFIAIEQNAIAQ